MMTRAHRKPTSLLDRFSSTSDEAESKPSITLILKHALATRIIRKKALACNGVFPAYMIA
jgi:hypothetical protein